MVALVGPSGAGKTTLGALVSRLYDPIDGQVLIGDHDARLLTLESLHAAVGVVTQDPHLFHDTIRRNLAYARPTATDEDMWQACRDAQIGELLERLPEGLDTVVGDRGYRLFELPIRFWFLNVVALCSKAPMMSYSSKADSMRNCMLDNSRFSPTRRDDERFHF